MSDVERLLLDTHVVLWWLTDDPTLSDAMKERIDQEIDVSVSVASVWEVAIKQARGKLKSGSGLAQAIKDCELAMLEIGAHHAVEAGRLPDIHRDPFDRMLIAQARIGRFALVTRDLVIRDYDVEVLRV